MAERTATTMPKAKEIAMMVGDNLKYNKLAELMALAEVDMASILPEISSPLNW
jgi:hypothetical protein